MLLFALHHPKIRRPIAYFSSDLYSFFSELLHSTAKDRSSFARGLSITVCFPPKNFLSDKLSDDYNGIASPRGKLLGVVQRYWLPYIITSINLPLKFKLL